MSYHGNSTLGQYLNPKNGDWRYAMIMPDGSVLSVTRGGNAAKFRFCVPCHVAVGDIQDHMFFAPPDVRMKF